MTKPVCCARCDGQFEKGDSICLVTFAHVTFDANVDVQDAKPSDYTWLCESCEDYISDAWPVELDGMV